MEWNVDRSLGIGGVVFATVLLVLDKAGKLKGPLLLILLAVALCMLIPVLFSIPWVAHTPTGSQMLAKKALMVFLLGSLWAGLCVWITSGDTVTASETIRTELLEQSKSEIEALDLTLIPHGAC